MRVVIKARWRAVLKNSTHTRIIDRLKPTGDLEDSCKGSKFWSASLKVCLGHGIARGISSRQ